MIKRIGNEGRILPRDSNGSTPLRRPPPCRRRTTKDQSPRVLAPSAQWERRRNWYVWLGFYLRLSKWPRESNGWDWSQKRVGFGSDVYKSELNIVDLLLWFFFHMYVRPCKSIKLQIHPYIYNEMTNYNLYTLNMNKS